MRTMAKMKKNNVKNVKKYTYLFRGKYPFLDPGMRYGAGSKNSKK